MYLQDLCSWWWTTFGFWDHFVCLGGVFKDTWNVYGLPEVLLGWKGSGDGRIEFSHLEWWQKPGFELTLKETRV
jgi:hypothetical protein